MSNGYDWLPALVLFSDYEEDWEKYLEALYSYFRSDFVTSKPSFPGKRMALKRQPLRNGKESTFWHLITEGNIEDDRTRDISRCERVRWPRPMLESLERDDIKYWENTRKQGKRIVIALSDFSYVFILADRGDYVLPWTAYPVEQNHRRRKFRSEYEEYERSQNG